MKNREGWFFISNACSQRMVLPKRANDQTTSSSVSLMSSKQNLKEQAIYKMLLSAVDNFFHARVGKEAFRKAAYIRIGFAILFLYDRFVSSGDYTFLFSNTTGVLPFWAGRDSNSIDPDIDWTLLSLFPDSDTWLWTLYAIGQVQAVLLLLGIYPRLQLLGLFVNIVSFNNHNALTRDAEDDMFRLWCFLLAFLPLHHLTIYDLLKSKKKKQTNDDHDDKGEQQPQQEEQQEQEESWPIWPFRVWQIYMCFIYLGAGLGKLDGPYWWPDGLAIFHVSHQDFVYPGLWNPDVIFNRLMPLKIICWSSLFFELFCPITIWIPGVTKTITLIGAVLLHVGIDVTMHMHVFEWLTLLGWYAFTVEPTAESIKTFPKPSWTRRLLLDTLVVVTLVTAFAVDTLPMRRIFHLAPDSIKPMIGHVGHWHGVARDCISPILQRAALSQGSWDMFNGAEPENMNTYFDAIITFDNGSQVIWKSPEWIKMSWWQRHRAIRPMNYYYSLAGPGDNAAWVTLCAHLARRYGLEVVHSITLRVWDEFGGDLPDDFDPWDYSTPVRQPMHAEEKQTLVTIQVCKDLDDQCPEWADDRECLVNPAFMRKTCPASCKFCEFLVEFKKSRLNYEWKYNNGPFQVARVNRRLVQGKYRRQDAGKAGKEEEGEELQPQGNDVNMEGEEL